MTKIIFGNKGSATTANELKTGVEWVWIIKVGNTYNGSLTTLIPFRVCFRLRNPNTVTFAMNNSWWHSSWSNTKIEPLPPINMPSRTELSAVRIIIFIQIFGLVFPHFLQFYRIESGVKSIPWGWRYGFLFPVPLRFSDIDFTRWALPFLFPKVLGYKFLVIIPVSMFPSSGNSGLLVNL